MPSRILVLSASVGAGHLRAAEAVELALRQIAPQAEIVNWDVLEFTNAVFRRIYARTYLDLVNRAPHLLGYFYERLDRPSPSGRYRGDRMRLALERLNLKRFERYLTSQPWDLVINTHFLPAELIGRLRRDDKCRIPQVTVCTDFLTHRLWVNEPCDRYFCATDEGRAYLQFWGVPSDKVAVTGIPVHPAFSDPIDQSTLRARHGLQGDRPLILQLCGGFGVGPVESIYRGLLELSGPVELVVVCGRNETLKDQLAAVEVPQRHRVHLLGFTREIDQLMACADLLVSKPGGLTTSEALARGLPLVVVNPIPGQESQNSDFLLERGAAIKVHHPSLLALKILRLLDEPTRLERMRAAARSLGRPRAAFDVAQQSLALAGIASESAVEARAEQPIGCGGNRSQPPSSS